MLQQLHPVHKHTFKSFSSFQVGGGVQVQGSPELLGSVQLPTRGPIPMTENGLPI